MTYRMYGALTASLGVIALILAGNETFARSGGGHGGGFAAAHAGHHSVARSLGHRRGRNIGGFWPGGGFYDDGSSNGQAVTDVPQPSSGDTHYTYTYDVPWDWAHRYPPNVIPSDRPYVSSCTPEAVTVPGAGGSEHTVNITRCY
jgi:hypothetical protein